LKWTANNTRGGMQRMLAGTGDLARLGCRVLRIAAQVVLQDLPRAVELVREAVALRR
jgi:hypothetical protein